MTPTKGNAYVIQHTDGRFLKGKSAWSKSWTEDLGQARLYAGKGHAKNSMNHTGRYERGNKPEMTIREVEVTLK